MLRLPSYMISSLHLTKPKIWLESRNALPIELFGQNFPHHHFSLVFCLWKLVMPQTCTLKILSLHWMRRLRTTKHKQPSDIERPYGCSTQHMVDNGISQFLPLSLGVQQNRHVCIDSKTKWNRRCLCKSWPHNKCYALLAKLRVCSQFYYIFVSNVLCSESYCYSKCPENDYVLSIVVIHLV